MRRRWVVAFVLSGLILVAIVHIWPALPMTLRSEVCWINVDSVDCTSPKGDPKILYGLAGLRINPISVRTDRDSLIYYSAVDHAVLERSPGKLTVYRLPKPLAAERVVSVEFAGGNLVLITEASSYLLQRRTGRFLASYPAAKLHYAGDNSFLIVTSLELIKAKFDNRAIVRTGFETALPKHNGIQRSYYDPGSKVLVLWDGLQSHVFHGGKWHRASKGFCLDPYNKCLWTQEGGIWGMFERQRCFDFEGRELGLTRGEQYPYASTGVVFSQEILDKVYMGAAPHKVIRVEMPERSPGSATGG